MKEIDDDDKIKQILDGINKILPASDIFLLAKFYRNQGLGEKGIKKQIILLLEDKYPRYNIIINRNLINKAVKNSMRCSKIKNFEKFWITENEVEEIKKYNNLQLEKIVFSLVCYCRSENKNLISHFEMKKILGFSGTRISYLNFQKRYLNVLGQNKFLVYDEYGLDEQGCYRIQLPEIKGKETISVESYSELHQSGGVWKIYIGENARCSVCGKEIRKKSNRQEMCKSCSGEIEKENARKRAKKQYVKKSTN